ncbi:hypothetical protein PRIPAC_85493 [Pristionchus pacificus]|uniref:Uncharacterized protein n=1 Tax=Pristionchus pacificus TaxID=54126 RepID=A0A2A6BTV1_PRIPA|nr:hypothetical protein PRIPAC_85493 [Pristionchus pacificus]|eukprot:PDM69330.1 hypothetical protein PRIPAC_47632 [Pristionchus pacificus]
MAHPATDQQTNPPSVVGTLYTEHERTSRFQENHAKRPRDCDPTTSFETKWAFTVAETKRADVEKKTTNQLTSATMTITFALREVKEEITEIDSLLCGINTREHELESMTSSLDKMCLTLAARSIDRKKQAELGAVVIKTGGSVSGYSQQQQVLCNDADMKTAKDETTMTSPTSNVSTADDISMAEHPPPTGTTVLPEGESPASPHYDTPTTANTALEVGAVGRHREIAARDDPEKATG